MLYVHVYKTIQTRDYTLVTTAWQGTPCLSNFTHSAHSPGT